MCLYLNLYFKAVNGILMWALNILDETSNLPNKAGNTYKKLYHNEWKTKETVQVNSNENSIYRALF